MTAEDAKITLLKLFQCYNLGGNEFERAMKFEAYWEVLAPLTPSAVVAACQQACRGNVGDPRFLPSAAQLYEAASKVVHYQPSKRVLQSALPRPPISEAEMMRRDELTAKARAMIRSWAREHAFATKRHENHGSPPR